MVHILLGKNAEGHLSASCGFVHGYKRAKSLCFHSGIQKYLKTKCDFFHFLILKVPATGKVLSWGQTSHCPSENICKPTGMFTPEELLSFVSFMSQLETRIKTIFNCR